MCFLLARNPFSMRILKYLYMSLSSPPITCTHTMFHIGMIHKRTYITKVANSVCVTFITMEYNHQSISQRSLLTNYNNWIAGFIRKHTHTNTDTSMYVCDVLLCTSANSGVSLKGELSKPRLFPGELARTNPKSMWMMWPSESTRMLPLCLCTQQRRWQRQTITHTHYVDVACTAHIFAVSHTYVRPRKRDE